jgi:hypothetical protein
MSKRKTHKPYSKMTTEELAAATADLDRERVGLIGEPLAKRDKELHRKARRPGRPRVGLGAKEVLVSIERGLLKATDALAKRRKVTRSQLIADALRDVLSRAKAG